jgi:uncharacterized protein YndB with AHSA1/START domain
MAEHRSTIEIQADPETIFDFLVTEAGMTAWMGQHAELDPRAGGVFAVDIAGYPIRGTYLEVDRPRRVKVSWGMAGSEALPPGASEVELTLTPTATGTRVDLHHSGLPTTEVPGHADGWTHFLPRLAIAGAGGDPGPDSWTPLPDRIPVEEP